MPTDRWIGPQNVLVVNTGRHLVLIDTGMGDRSKALGPDNGHLMRNLALAGIDPAAIDVVAITHAHIDHCWGLVDARDRLNFPNARVAIAMSDYEFWTQESLLANPAARDFVLYTRTNLLPVRDRIIPVRDGAEVVPGITAMATPGHTVGHHSYVIESGGQRLVNVGDVLHHHVLLLRHPEWHNIFDSDKAQGAATRRRILETMSADGTQCVLYHFPVPGGWPVIIAAALIIFYVAWTPFLKRGLEPSEERMSVRDNIATQARIHNKGMLWAMAIVSIAFVAAGIAMLIFDPRQWLVALGSIVFFGFCAIVIGRMIMLRRREAR